MTDHIKSRLLTAIVSGELVSDLDSIDATLLREVVTQGQTENSRQPWRLRVSGAAINGDLDLADASVGFAMSFEECDFHGTVDLSSARVQNLRFQECSFRGGADKGFSFLAADAQISGGLSLHGSKFRKPVYLINASIGGDLELTSVTFCSSTDAGESLIADSLWVRGSIYLTPDSCKGAMTLNGSTVDRSIFTSEGSFDGLSEDGRSLSLDFATVRGNMHFEKAFSNGTLSLIGANIQGSLIGTGAKLHSPPKGCYSFQANMIRIGGSVSLEEAEFAGSFHFLEAKVRGQFYAPKSHYGLSVGREASINADFVEVGGGLFLDNTTFSGPIRIPGSSISGQVQLRGATFSRYRNKCASPALLADNLVLKGDLNLGISSSLGTISLRNSQITGNLDLEGSKITQSENNAALDGDGIKIIGRLLIKGMETKGTIQLTGAEIQTLETRCLDEEQQIRVYFDHAVIGAWEVGSNPAKIPSTQVLSASGAVIKQPLGPPFENPRSVVKWLKGTNGSALLPVFAEHYERKGLHSAGNLLRYNNALANNANEPLLTRLLGILYRITTGFGYYPALSLVWLAAVIGAAFFFTWLAADQFTLIELSHCLTIEGSTELDDANKVIADSCVMTPTSDIQFNPLIFSIETLTLGGSSESFWEAPTWLTVLLASLRFLTWVFTALLLTGITGLLKKAE